MAKMTRDELKSIVKARITDSVGYIDGEIQEERRENLDYYYGEPFGNEIKDRSQVVSTDVQDVIESIMPDLVEMFAAGDEVGKFEPVGPEDEQAADQATDYVNFIWMKDNPGFEIIHDWIKDAILQNYGVIKQYWDGTPVKKKETLTGVNILRLSELEADPDIKIIRFNETESVEDDMPGEPEFEIEVERTVSRGQVVIEGIPPEEFLIAKRSKSLRDADFTCHRTRKTQSELIKMGYDRDKIEKLPSATEPDDTSGERDARFQNETPSFGAGSVSDRAMRPIEVHDCYLRVDYDGDGIAEMRQVFTAGPAYEILETTEVDEHPFNGASPIRVPHRAIGRAVADLVKDIQELKSILQRALNDNLYYANNGRAFISERVNLDDYLTDRPGGAIRVEGDDVNGAMLPIPHNPMAQHILPVIEYWDGVKENRTGVSRLNQGLDPDSLNKTATGINLLLGRTQKRILLIARLFAEIGFKEAFKRTLRLITQHQEKSRIIRLRNQWFEMNPKNWNPEMDVSVSVGLGYGSKEQQIVMFEKLLQMQAQAIEMQGGPGPLVGLPNVFHAWNGWLRASGVPNRELFVSDPTNAPPQQPKPDPEMQKVQMEAQAAQAQMQIDMQKNQAQLQLDREKAGADLQLQREKMQADIQLEREKMMMEGQQAQVNAQADREMNQGLETERIASNERVGTKPAVQLGLPDGLAQGMEQMLQNQTQAISQAMQVLAQAAQVIAQAAQVMSAPREITMQTPSGTKTAVARPMLQ